MAQKRFHRHFETPGLPLYWIIIAYIILGWFFPVIGLLAIGAGGADMYVLVAICTIDCSRNIHPIVRFQSSCAPSASACSWCSSSLACSAFS